MVEDPEDGRRKPWGSYFANCLAWGKRVVGKGEAGMKDVSSSGGSHRMQHNCSREKRRRGRLSLGGGQEPVDGVRPLCMILSASPAHCVSASSSVGWGTSYVVGKSERIDTCKRFVARAWQVVARRCQLQ